MLFANRREAGDWLADKLATYEGRQDAVVLALPRGGVPVAFEIAQALHLPLDVMLVRKLGVPGHEELAMGAIAGGGVRVLNEDIVHSLNIPPLAIERVAEAEQREMERRNQAYREGRAGPDIKGKTVILVDDGMATGANMRAAADAARKAQVARVVVAVPVASDSACALLEQSADEVVCLEVPRYFSGVGAFYSDFEQTSDSEVQALLNIAQQQEQKKTGAAS